VTPQQKQQLRGMVEILDPVVISPPPPPPPPEAPPSLNDLSQMAQGGPQDAEPAPPEG